MYNVFENVTLGHRKCCHWVRVMGNIDIYAVSHKNDTDVAHYNFNAR